MQHDTNSNPGTARRFCLLRKDGIGARFWDDMVFLGFGLWAYTSLVYEPIVFFQQNCWLRQQADRALSEPIDHFARFDKHGVHDDVSRLLYS